MDFGLGLLGYAGCWDDAAFAEEHGFSTAGFVDSPLLGGDPFVCMALAATRTSTLRLGTFLAVPGNRTAAVTASAMATVAALAPGRTFLAVGTGNTSRRTFGRGPVAAARVGTFADECRALLAGEEVTPADGAAYRFVHADGYVNAGDTPVYVAADGPKALAAAGTGGEGWVSTMQYSHLMLTSPDVFAASLTAVQAAAAGAGRPAPSYTVLSAGLCLLEPGESAVSPRALETVGPVAMLAFHAWADNPAIGDFLPPPIRDRLPVYQELVLDRFPGGPERRHQHTHAGHLSHLLPGEAEVLTDDIVRMTTLTGLPQEVAGTLGRLAAAGLDNVSLWIPPAVTRRVILEIEEHLMPLLAGHPVPATAG